MTRSTATRGRTIRPGLVLLLLFLTTGCATAPPSSMADARVSGTVTYRERIALPPDAVLEVALLDTSRMDVAAIVLAEQRIDSPGQVPVSFSLAYDPARIDPRMSYAVRATIRVDDRPLFVTDRAWPVLTRGHSERVDVVLVRSARTE
ncbi:MAG TPA: YbaY family lipoprotein [Pseudomonadales bacterium]|nr:YbaY family lipoprotein [Pseudomonadales bacterium]